MRRLIMIRQAILFVLQILAFVWAIRNTRPQDRARTALGLLRAMRGKAPV